MDDAVEKDVHPRNSESDQTATTVGEAQTDALDEGMKFPKAPLPHAAVCAQSLEHTSPRQLRCRRHHRTGAKP